MNQTTTKDTASIDLAQLDSLQRYADSCVPTALPSEKLGALIALARRSLTSGAPAEPIYQAQFEGEYGSVVWHDVTEAAYHTFMPQYRRIVRIHDAAAPCDCCKDIREAETIHGDGPDAAAASAEQAPAAIETEMADRLRRIVLNHPGTTIQVSAKTLAAAADECDRFYNGMMNWKANAQAKDRTIIELREVSAGAAAKTDQDDEIRGPLTDAQREECRTLYNNLKHLQCGGIYVADDVIRRAAVFGYMNGRKDFGTPAPAAGAGSAQPEALNEIFAAIDEAQRMNRYNESSFEIASRVARLKCLADNYRAAMRANDGAAEGGSQK